MDYVDPNVPEEFTTKEKLLDDVENQGMNPKQKKHDHEMIEQGNITEHKHQNGNKDVCEMIKSM